MRNRPSGKRQDNQPADRRFVNRARARGPWPAPGAVRSETGASSREESLTRQAETLLAGLVEEIGRRLLGKGPAKGSILVPVEFEAAAAGRWSLKGERLVEMVENALLEAAASASPFRQGRVFCYLCESASCPHSVPARSTEVFSGYSATGLPQWSDLGQVLLDAKHPEVDRLYDGRPRVVSMYLSGRDLKTRQLSAFGRSSKSYDILGQIVAGYFRTLVPGGETDPASRVALSIQAVESPDCQGVPRLHLNVIGRTERGEDAYTLLLETLGDAIGEPVVRARHGLRNLELRLAGKEARTSLTRRRVVWDRVPAIMNRLSQSFVHLERRKHRRTHHAQRRREQERPVPLASKEASRCRPDSTFVDESRGTMIVMGRKNRIHVFNPDACHVTSLVMLPDAVHRRLKLKRWRSATSDEFARFRRNLHAKMEAR